MYLKLSLGQSSRSPEVIELLFKETVIEIKQIAFLFGNIELLKVKGQGQERLNVSRLNARSGGDDF